MAKFETQEAEELLTIDLASDLPLGPAKLNCSFEGTLNDRLVGFYRSKYTQVLELAVITIIFYLGYKIFKQKTLSTIQKSINMKSMNLKSANMKSVISKPSPQQSSFKGNYIDKKCPFTGNVSIRGRIVK